jgi:hypothetical protein
MIKKQKEYFTLEQISRMKKHYSKPNNIEADKFACSWNKLNSSTQSEMENGMPIDYPRVIDLA